MRKHYIVWVAILPIMEKIPGKVYDTEEEAKNAAAKLNNIYADNGFDMEAFYSEHEY